MVKVEERTANRKIQRASFLSHQTTKPALLGEFWGGSVRNLACLNLRLLYSDLDVIDDDPIHFVRCRRVHKPCHRSKIEH